MSRAGADVSLDKPWLIEDDEVGLDKEPCRGAIVTIRYPSLCLQEIDFGDNVL